MEKKFRVKIFEREEKSDYILEFQCPEPFLAFFDNFR